TAVKMAYSPLPPCDERQSSSQPEFRSWPAARHSGLPLGAIFQLPRDRTGKSGESAGWKAFPTLLGAVSQTSTSKFWQALPFPLFGTDLDNDGELIITK